jgi:hypothetical protein
VTRIRTGAGSCFLGNENTENVMTIVRAIAIALIAFKSLAFAPTQATSDAHEGSLEELRGKTGWIPLGLVTADKRRWAIGADPAVDYDTGAFEFVDKTTNRRRPVLPRAGERIRLTARNRVTILDFASTGERRAMDDPSAVHPSGSELTDILLAKGSVVEVREVRLSPSRGGSRTVWARVVPAKGKS